jgi:ubiquitin-protein ligase
LKNGNKIVHTYNHTFRIELPREYPARVDKIKLFSETQIFHPRFATSGWGEGCIHINGEIDRILMDMIFQVLCDPDRIRPPKLYSDSDFGTNSTAMKWYQQNNPKEIYDSLMKEWEKYRNKRLGKDGHSAKIVDESSSSKPSTTEKKGVRIID